jgi:hypothetical protein
MGACHQLVYLIDPLPQIRKWGPKIFHVHGKDATVRWEVIREHGIFGKVPFVWMRTPGFGDSNWTDIISELRLAGSMAASTSRAGTIPSTVTSLEGCRGQIGRAAHLKAARGWGRFRGRRAAATKGGDPSLRQD